MTGTTIPQAALPSATSPLTDPITPTNPRGRIASAWYSWARAINSAVRTTAQAAVGAFTDLSDCPSSYGTAGQIVQIDSGANGLAFGNIWSAPCTVAALPASPSQGDRGFVTDATVTTFAAVIAGSGTHKVPVVYDGTHWIIG